MYYKKSKEEINAPYQKKELFSKLFTHLYGADL